MKSTKRNIGLVAGLALVILLAILGSNYYFNSKLLDEASHGCYQNGGTPIISKDAMLISYSFECKVEKIDWIYLFYFFITKKEYLQELVHIVK